MQCYYCGNELGSGEGEHYGLHPQCFREAFGVHDLHEFLEIARVSPDTKSQEDSDVNKDEVVSSFFQGKFRKYSGRLGNTPYIMKVKEEEYPELPVVENLCNQVARVLGLEVPDFQLIRFFDVPTFTVRNFIQPGRIETLHHIYHFLDGGSFDCETLINVIGEKTGRIVDIERFVSLCLFDSLIGNHDRHGRNLGLIEKAGQYRLAPFYDNPSYIGIETEALLPADHSPRGHIATSSCDEPVMTDYIEEFSRLGYESVIDEFRKRASMPRLLEASGWQHLSKDRENAFLRLIEKRLRQVRNE